MPSELREPIQGLRERGSPGASAFAVEFVTRHREAWLIYAAGALLLAHVGAFQTGDTPLLIRLPYFLTLALTGGLLAAVFLDLVGRRARRPSEVGKALAAIGLVTLLETPVVWVAAALVLEGSWQPVRLVDLAGQVLPIIAAFVALQLFLSRSTVRVQAMLESIPPDESFVPPAEPPEPLCGPSLLARLPAHLHGAELQAVEAEDHYLRLHTDQGSAMLLLTLTQAITLLNDVEGARTHRSWWVAKSAIAGVSCKRGRATLILKNGVSAPVSRTYAPRLRSAGWFLKA